MLDWLNRHHPATARRAIGAAAGEAERRLGIPRAVTERSLQIALSFDGKLGDDALTEYLSRVTTPAGEDGT